MRNKNSSFLVTTNLEKNFKINHAKIFAGRWVKKNKKDKFFLGKAKDQEYEWNKNNNFDQDYSYLKGLHYKYIKRFKIK